MHTATEQVTHLLGTEAVFVRKAYIRKHNVIRIVGENSECNMTFLFRCKADVQTKALHQHGEKEAEALFVPLSFCFCVLS